MNDLRQAAEMALKYFEDAYGLEDEEVVIKEALRQALTPEVTPEVDNAYTKLDTSDRVLHKEWVWLTDEERSYYLQAAANVGWWRAVFFVEAKLKEKNT
jgi:hypothetical protein